MTDLQYASMLEAWCDGSPVRRARPQGYRSQLDTGVPAVDQWPLWAWRVVESGLGRLARADSLAARSEIRDAWISRRAPDYLALAELRVAVEEIAALTPYVALEKRCPADEFAESR